MVSIKNLDLDGPLSSWGYGLAPLAYTVIWVPTSLPIAKVAAEDVATSSAPGRKWAKPGEHVLRFKFCFTMNRHHQKGFYSEKCKLKRFDHFVPFLGTHLVQCVRSATIWVVGRTRNPCFVILRASLLFDNWFLMLLLHCGYGIFLFSPNATHFYLFSRIFRMVETRCPAH